MSASKGGGTNPRGMSAVDGFGVAVQGGADGGGGLALGYFEGVVGDPLQLLLMRVVQR